MDTAFAIAARAPIRCAMAVLVLLLSLPAAAAPAGDAPVPPCGEAAWPSFRAAGAPPAVRVWTPRDLGAHWQPPACTGWTASDFQLVVALAGSFESARTRDGLLEGFGAVSQLLGVRYWSVTDNAWRALFSAATALEAPDLKRLRADFTAAEMTGGGNLYFADRDSRSSGQVIYRMRVRDADDGRFVVEMENVTPVRFYLLTLFPPGALQSVFFLQRSAPMAWGYYGLVRTRAGAALFSNNRDSYVNRALALFYHYAGLRAPE
jgi:hypothetical protein